MKGGDSKVNAEWLEAQRIIFGEQTGKYLLSWGAGLKRNWGSAELPEVRRKGPGETGKATDPGQEPWVTSLEARPLAPPSALFKSTKIESFSLTGISSHFYCPITQLLGLFTELLQSNYHCIPEGPLRFQRRKKNHPHQFLQL